jgi:branched-chain amino acid transport system substrate-binding protein
MKSWRPIAWTLALVLSSTWAHAAEPRVVKVGIQLPLTGERAQVGQVIQNGVRMALDAVNAEGRTGVRVEPVWADDESAKEMALEALTRLLRDPQVVAVVGEIFSPFVLAGKPLVEQAGIPYFTGGTSPRTTEQTQWIFRVAASDALLVRLLARYVAEQLKVNKLAVLHDGTGIHNARAELLVKLLEEQYGIVPLVRASWKPGDRDFRSQLEMVKATPAQVILALGETGEGAPFLRQVKSMGVQAQVIAHRDFGARRVLEEAGAAAEGVEIVTEYAPELQDDQRQAWARAYEQRFGGEANIIAAQYHDAILLLAEAATRGGPTRAGVRAGLERLQAFPGAMADYTFDAGRNGVHRFYVVRITGGKPGLKAVLEETP